MLGEEPNIMIQEIRIYKLYLGKEIPSWPKPDLDFNEEMQRLDQILDTVALKVRKTRGFRVF